MKLWLLPFTLRRALPPPKPKTYPVTPDISSDNALVGFYEAARLLDGSACVLEAGTKQATPGSSTHSHGQFPGLLRSHYVMVDVEPGHDVDLVADLHCLPDDWTNRFDAFVANAVFEHLERPWIAAKEVARVLKPGGICLVSTHQTFPLHGYPSDFFRFSKEALSLIFEDAGLRVVDAGYRERAQIIAPPHVVPSFFSEEWNDRWPSYIHVHVFARKDL